MEQVITLTTTGRFAVCFRSVGNPDFGQYRPISKPIKVTSDTLENLIHAAKDYQEFWSIGAGNWPKMVVTENGKKIGQLSYNCTMIREGGR